MDVFDILKLVCGVCLDKNASKRKEKNIQRWEMSDRTTAKPAHSSTGSSSAMHSKSVVNEEVSEKVCVQPHERFETFKEGPVEMKGNEEELEPETEPSNQTGIDRNEQEATGYRLIHLGSLQATANALQLVLLCAASV